MLQAASRASCSKISCQNSSSSSSRSLDKGSTNNSWGVQHSSTWPSCTTRQKTYFLSQSHVRSFTAARCPRQICGGLKENISQLAPIDTVSCVDVTSESDVTDAPAATSTAAEATLKHAIPNAPGKKASVAIYSHLAQKYGGRITTAAAQEGLQLYDEFVEEAQQQPGSHPNIDLLLDVLKSGRVLKVTVHHQQPNQQQPQQ